MLAKHALQYISSIIKEIILVKNRFEQYFIQFFLERTPNVTQDVVGYNFGETRFGADRPRILIRVNLGFKPQ